MLAQVPFHPACFRNNSSCAVPLAAFLCRITAHRGEITAGSPSHCLETVNKSSSFPAQDSNPAVLAQINAFYSSRSPNFFWGTTCESDSVQSVSRRRTLTQPQTKNTEAALEMAATQKVQLQVLGCLQSTGRISQPMSLWAKLQMGLKLPPNTSIKQTWAYCAGCGNRRSNNYRCC